MNDRFYSCARALVATFRTGSMSAAALELRTTKSAISQKLSLFEAELGLVLLDRSGRSVSPTAAGKRIFDICVGSIDIAAEAEAQLGLLRSDRISGRVAISGPNTILCTIFMPMLAGLSAKYPDIEIELCADDARTDFSIEDIDLSFRTGTPGKGNYVTSLLRLADKTLCASPLFLQNHPEIEHPKDLEKMPCILRQHESPEWRLKDQKDRYCTVSPNVSLRTNTMEMSHAAAKLGNGIALLPTLAVQGDLDSGALVHFLPSWGMDQVPISLLCRAARLSAPEVAAVRQFIMKTCIETT